MARLLICSALLMAGCRSADVGDHDASASPNHRQIANKEELAQASQSRKGSWRVCRRDADCEKDHVCVAVDRRLEQAVLLGSLGEPKACAELMPRHLALQDAPDFERRYLERLVVFPKVRLALTLTTCTAVACFHANGAPVDCCNRCDGEHVRLSGFADVSMVQPDGQILECKDHMDCERPSCPGAVQLDKDLKIAGAFHIVGGRLTFLLATDPERWIDPY